ncbi:MULTISPECIES: enoyl-CoA hydratase/isomerase family protein [Rhodanobacter]|uniref:enoyl-CoA hydratase/isomerase family protein n=1 Tax=Rhodanobacter TaxID=75309 RepID=UPI0003FF6194|nr:MULTISPECIES: enoyl-CoA hydratase-related protein [Rhodanobacter]TAN17636.1 MAG: enoyl-CoA hydratase [Rhodanobacter sp.]UJJ53959.1 enoyl-CoA hydratase-related protein [Rhodanobacter thiooxydans]
MAYRNLEISNRGAVRTIVVNRPDKLNALNRDTLNELSLVFAQAAQDDAVRVVVLTGAGEKAFVAGADIAEMSGYTPVQARGFSRAGQRLMASIERLGKPVIARIQGFALGGGMELAMACHLRVASEKAKLGQPEINLGLIPGFGGTQRLLRLAGRGAALELCLTGAPIGAQRAYELGIVNRVVAPEALDETVNTLADQLAAAAPLAAAGILDAVLQGGENAIDQGLEFETQGFALVFSTADMREGTGAFLEKRKAVFKGA